MKIKILYTFLAISLIACTKPCDQAAACSDVVGSNGACQAYFERWFYNDATGECELQGHSGCSPLGFETQSECEKCDCN